MVPGWLLDLAFSNRCGVMMKSQFVLESSVMLLMKVT